MANPENPVKARNEAFNRLVPGELIEFEVNSFSGRALETTQVAGTISEVHGGGFYGKVLALKECGLAVKLAQPEAKYDFWRLVNWRELFPPQTNEMAAQLGHLSARIAHKLIPWVTDNPKVITPDSLGYTHIDNLGFAQVLELIEDGRPPRFDVGVDEVGLIRNAQNQLLEVGTKFGMESVLGQAHPDNPFAFANLWIGREGQVYLLDLHAAMQHTNLVWPGYYFFYHSDIKKRMKSETMTFDKIHTLRFQQALWEERDSIPAEVVKSLKEDLHLYQGIKARYSTSGPKSFADACAGGGLLTEEQAKELSSSTLKQAKLAFKLAFDPWFEVVSSLITERGLVKFVANQQFRSEVFNQFWEIVKDSEFRQDWMLEKFALAGVIEAQKQGIISQDELEQIRAEVAPSESSGEEEKKKMMAHAGLLSAFFVSSRILDTLEGSSYLSAFFVDNPEAAIARGIFIGWICPSLIRPTLAWMVEQYSGVDMKVAKKVSVIPKIGSHLAVPLNLANLEASRSEAVRHFALRDLVAKLSNFSHWGGWGTGLEAKLWQRLPSRIKDPKLE